MKSTALLKKIINKGGLIGSCGKLYVFDEGLATQYIIECSKQLHSEAIRNLWGKKLVEQIESYTEFSKKMAG
jgi:hypothetical protein